MPSYTHLTPSNPTTNVTFLIDIYIMIDSIYDSLVEEFFTYDELKNELLDSVIANGDALVGFMSYGYDYLRVAKWSEFYDIIPDIDYDPGKPHSLIKDYVLENAINRFICYIAYTLLSETNVDLLMNKQNFKLIRFKNPFITFSFQKSNRVANIISKHYQDNV